VGGRLKKGERGVGDFFNFNWNWFFNRKVLNSREKRKERRIVEQRLNRIEEGMVLGSFNPLLVPGGKGEAI